MPDNSAATDTVQTVAARLTPSAVGDLSCPAKFRLLRIDRVWEKRDVILAVARGKAVHAVLRDVYTERQGGTLDLTRLEAQARSAVRNTWYPRDCDKEAEVQWAMRVVRAFAENDDYEDIEGTLAVEVQGQFEVRTGGRVLCVMSAKLDALLVRNSAPRQLVIRERKTTAQRISLAEVYIQARIAAKMYPEFRPQDIVVEFDWLDPEDFRITRDVVTAREIVGQHAIVLGRAYKVLTADEFPAIPGEEVCKFCPKREACQSLHADEMSEAVLRGMAEQIEG